MRFTLSLSGLTAAVLSISASAGSVVAEPSAALASDPGPRVELIDPAALGFGFAGFTADATLQGQLGYDGREGGIDLFELRTIAPLGKVNVGSWLFAGTLNYTWTQADFGGLQGLGNVDLHELEATIVASWRRPNSPWWVLAFLNPGLATDFQNVSGDAFTASALGLLGYRWNPRLDLAVGVFANYALDEVAALGAIGIIWRPSDRWILQATPPIIALGFKPTRDWTFGAVTYPGGGAWEVGERDSTVRQVDLSLWRAALSVEKKFGEHWRVSARAGIAFGGELELRDDRGRVLTNRDLDPAPFGAVALRWAF